MSPRPRSSSRIWNRLRWRWAWIVPSWTDERDAMVFDVDEIEQSNAWSSGGSP